jgi:predicted TIM-barrel fold metal-dependent hydrolase
MLITDAQVHIWEVDNPGRPWPQPWRNQPQLPGGFSAEAMIAAMDQTGVDRAIIVPPTWAGDGNETALETVQTYPDRFAIMGRIDTEAPGAAELLERWLQQPNMLGIRMTFRVPVYRDLLLSGRLDWFWDATERLGIPVACLVAGEASILEPVAAKYPGLTLVLDHMGCILEGPPEHAFSTIEESLTLAKYPAVSVKVSSAPCFSAQDYPFADVIPYLKRFYDAYGPRRMMWGADLTRLRGTYSECLRQFQEALDFLSDDDKEWVLGRTAAEVLNWPEAPRA